MEQQQEREETVLQLNDPTTVRATTEAPLPVAVAPQASAGSCPTCAGAQASPSMSRPSCVYVIGHIEPRYPLLSVEKEAMQAVSRAGVTKDTDRQVMAKVLQDPNNRYLVRQLCWVLLVQGIETYILVPRDGNYQPLVDAYRAEPNPGDLELVIGVRGPIAPPTMCNGLLVPIVIFDQIYAFDRKSLLEAIPVPKDADAKRFSAAAAEMFDRILHQSDNHGATPEDIAKNYLAVRYAGIYSLAAKQSSNNASLSSIDVLPSPLSGTRKIVDVVFAFTDRATDVVSKYFVRVDVTECFPFLVSKMAPYYDR
jgi:cyclic patellamide precursor peptide PatG